MTNFLPLIEKIKFLKAYSIYPQNETLEAHIKLNINSKLSEQNFIHKFIFPNMLHKSVTILAFSNDVSKNSDLYKAGADYVANEELIQQIKKGKVFFDYCVASPESMKLISPLAKILGPKGLMPNTKLGTLDHDLVNAIRKLKKGQFSLRNDKFGIVHVAVGNLNFSADLLCENISSLIDFIQSKKLLSHKGVYIESIYLTSTEGPSVIFDNIK